MTEVSTCRLGYRLYAEVNIAVDPLILVEEQYAIAIRVRHRTTRGSSYLSNVFVHVGSFGSAGESFHRLTEHDHNDFRFHSLNIRLSNPGYFCSVISCPGKHDSPTNRVVKHFLDFRLKLPAFRFVIYKRIYYRPKRTYPGSVAPVAH